MITKEQLKFIMIVLIVVNLCFFLFMQFLQFKYKAEFLLQPCELCTKLNPQVTACFNEKFTVRQYGYEINITGLNFSEMRG